MKRIHVAAAVILDEQQRILIARRPVDKHMGGLWEFPGGKVEPGEDVTVALNRELDEELGIQVTACEPLIQIRHDYPDKSVLLDVWTVTAFTGEPRGREGQPVKWVESHDLASYEFPAANKPIVTAALLPKRYLITGAFEGVESLCSKVEKALGQEIDLIQLRVSCAPDSVSQGDYHHYVEALQPLVEGRAQLMVKGDLSWLDYSGIKGLHLTARQLIELSGKGWKKPSQYADKWLAASCHSQDELERAQAIGADFVTLSPLLATASHPNAQPMGWDQASELIAKAVVPVYCLGGLTEGDTGHARRVGAQGISAIRAWWRP